MSPKFSFHHFFPLSVIFSNIPKLKFPLKFRFTTFFLCIKFSSLKSLKFLHRPSPSLDPSLDRLNSQEEAPANSTGEDVAAAMVLEESKKTTEKKKGLIARVWRGIFRSGDNNEDYGRKLHSLSKKAASATPGLKGGPSPPGPDLGASSLSPSLSRFLDWERRKSRLTAGGDDFVCSFPMTCRCHKCGWNRTSSNELHSSHSSAVIGEQGCLPGR